MPNMFEKAKSNTKPAPKKGKKEKRQVEVAGLNEYAAFVAVEKALEGVKQALAANVKEQVVAEFVRAGSEKGVRPESFRGVDGEKASASCEMRKRSTRSGLSATEQEFLNEHGIAFEQTFDVEERFTINPKYAEDMDLLAKVSEALADIVPDDFLEHQAPVSRHTVTDASVAEVYEYIARNNNAPAEELLRVVCTPALKPTIEGGDISEALKTMNEILGGDEDDS